MMTGNGRPKESEIPEKPEHKSNLGEAIATAKLSVHFYLLVGAVAAVLTLPVALGGPVVSCAWPRSSCRIAYC